MSEPWTDRFLPTADGLTLYAREYEPCAPASGLPVICLHGLTRNCRDFEVVAPRIAALGRRVIAIDMRGRGRSDFDPQPERYLPPTYARDVIAVMERLEIDTAVFLGTSMGGLISMLVAALAPGRVGACVLNDVGPQLNPVAIARIADYVGKTAPLSSWDDAAAAVRRINETAFPGKDEAFWMAFAKRLCRALEDGRVGLDYDPAIAAPFGQADGAAPGDVMSPLFQQGLGSVPTLLIRGALTDLLTPEGVAAMRALKPDLEVIDVPGVGHAPLLDEPEAWDALLLFLARAA